MKLKTDDIEPVDEISSSGIPEIVANSSKRKILNEKYLNLSPAQKQRFHTKFSKAFRDRSYSGNSGVWNVHFAGKTVQMPLNKERMWLDWDSALSIVGHDVEVKQTYEALVNSTNPPELFIDIGANYGTHSLLFLVQPIETTTFEPNASCHSFFREICELNEVSPRLKAVALGAGKGKTTLTYPEQRTWLGSTDAEVAGELSTEHEVVTDTVPQKTLDNYLPRMKAKKTLVKIDTEGNELAVLQGAEKILKEVQPTIIFESFGEGERKDLFHFLSDESYNIYGLPWHPDDRQTPLSYNKFLKGQSLNFIAVE